MKKIFITSQYPGEPVDRLSRKYEVEIYSKPETPSPEELIDGARGCSAIITTVADILDRKLIDSCPDLRVVANAGVGYENIDVEYATEKGIYVTNTPDVLTETTADLAWTLMMSVARRILEADSYVRDGKFKCWHPSLLLGMSVSGMTLGIFGMGRIGSAVARRAQGFDMRVLYHNRRRNRKAESHTSALFSDFDSLLKESDFIVVAAPLNDESRGRFGEAEFAAMKETAIIVNIGRGPIIKEAELACALADGVIWGAGLDVYEYEPDVNTELLELPNVVLLPHIDGASVATRIKMIDMAVSNVELALQGKAPLNLVNPGVIESSQ